MTVGITTACVAGLVVVTGCGSREKDVVGKYTRTGGIVNEVLILRSNHFYEQKLDYSDGKHFTQTNTWFRVKGVIRFKDLYVPVDVLTHRELERPQIYNDSNLEIAPGLLIGNFDDGYFYRKVEE